MTGWIVETLIGTSLLLVIVLALREPVARTFGARVAYLLWLAPALRLVLPPVPESWLPSAVAPVDDIVVTIAGAPEVSAVPAAEVAGAVTPAVLAAPVDWAAVLLAVWLGGAVLFFLFHALSYLRFTRAVMTDARPLYRERGIDVAESGRVSAPIAFGLAHPAVVLPANFDQRFDALEQRLAVAHEIAHHRRGDVAVNFVALAVLALFWWNPLAHFAHAMFRLDQEAACDDTVLDGASADERSAYALALFKAATGGVPLAACTMATKNQLKLRLRRIIRSQHGSVPVRAGLVMMAVMLPVGLLGTASNTVAAKAADAVEAKATGDAMPMLVLNGGVIDAVGDDAFVEVARDRAAWQQAVAEEARREAAIARREAREAAMRAREALARGNRSLQPRDHPEELAWAQEAAREAEEAARHAVEQARQAEQDAREARREALIEAREARREAATALREAEHEMNAELRSTVIRLHRVPVAPPVTAPPVPPAAPVPAVRVDCPDKAAKRTVAATVLKSSEGTMSVALCSGALVADRAMIRREMIKGLSEARSGIAAEAELDRATRARIVAMIDARLAELKGKENW